MKSGNGVYLACGVISLALLVGCNGGGSSKRVLRMEGSDTMVNLAQAWAEEYHKLHPEVQVQVSGGGSGVGIASLIDGVADLASSSRKMKDKERQLAEQNSGQAPLEHVVGLDALAIYVHKDNPLETISLQQLAEIYAEDGSITKWTQLGVSNAGCKSDEITRVSRQNNSGTYHYFREAVLGEREYKLGSIDQSGSKDVVTLVSRTPCAIGYSGMGYHTDEVKWVKVATREGEEGVEPSVGHVKDGSYPISRPLLIYTLGEPAGAVKDFLDWIHSAQGQKIVQDLGYVPLHADGPAGPAPLGEDAPEPAAPQDATPPAAPASSEAVSPESEASSAEPAPKE